eukprot:scaffold73362_cov19-Tisochrysis_lutea.AAC.1
MMPMLEGVDKDATIVLVCATATRSKPAVKLLQEKVGMQLCVSYHSFPRLFPLSGTHVQEEPFVFKGNHLNSEFLVPRGHKPRLHQQESVFFKCGAHTGNKMTEWFIHGSCLLQCTRAGKWCIGLMQTPFGYKNAMELANGMEEYYKEGLPCVSCVATDWCGCCELADVNRWLEGIVRVSANPDDSRNEGCLRG